MKVNGEEITEFEVTTYADMFHRKAVLAYTSDGECYGDVTINIPELPLDKGESFLNAKSPNLIKAMVESGYLEITGEVKVNYGTYKIGKFTQKFIDEFERVKDENESLKDYLVGCIESDEDLVKLGYHENEKFINDVIEEYESNLKYVEDGYSEIDAKDDAIETVSKRWLKEI